VSLNGTEQQADEIKNQATRKFGFIDDPKSFDVMAFKHKAVSHIEFMFTRSMFQTEDLQKQHEILNEVARLIDLYDKTTLAENFGTINAENLRKAHAFLEQERQ
jgi:hypothetical protein